MTSQKQQEFQISVRFLKDGSNILAKPIAEICNISISPGLFPSDCKIAKLKTLYKTTIDIKGYWKNSIQSGR